jgi:hypothetical protein
MNTKFNRWMGLCVMVFSPIILIGMLASLIWMFLEVGWAWSKDLIERIPTD